MAEEAVGASFPCACGCGFPHVATPSVCRSAVGPQQLPAWRRPRGWQPRTSPRGSAGASPSPKVMDLRLPRCSVSLPSTRLGKRRHCCARGWQGTDTGVGAVAPGQRWVPLPWPTRSGPELLLRVGKGARERLWSLPRDTSSASSDHSLFTKL